MAGLPSLGDEDQVDATQLWKAWARTSVQALGGAAMAMIAPAPW